jgi:hypothetical protein
MRARTMAPLAALLLAAQQADAQARSPVVDANDPRSALGAGLTDPGQLARGMEPVAHVPTPEAFRANSNTDMAFRGGLLFVGHYDGFQVYDISDPAGPRLRGSLVCPGGQGDISIWGNLLFFSVEEMRGRVDCGGQGVGETVSAERFRGVRIFDVSDPGAPRQVAAVQTCRGSHTHTLLADPRDPENLYVYVSGTAPVRAAAELEGCSGLGPDEDPNTALFRIEVIRVPLAAPQEARIVSTPRVFADPRTGNVAGLWPGGRQGEGAQETAVTNRCHDLTLYPELGLGAGACSGNGILLDLSDPVNPVRVHEVFDPNFAYWHSATFSNDGSKLIFTDEWGGGRMARCQATDRPEWGANALFTVRDRRMEPAGYYKLPAAQSELENCVAHNGSLVPVPGRDIMVQAWYQGGISVFDFTDPREPVEIAYFDRGPNSAEELVGGGFWSAYWYNGHVYGTDMLRGLDVFRLLPSMHLSHNEIEAARLVRQEQWNPQMQERIVWPAAFPVARAYVDQLVRNRGLPVGRIGRVAEALNRAEEMGAGAARSAALARLAGQLDADARTAGDPERVRALAGVVRELARAAR